MSTREAPWTHIHNTKEFCTTNDTKEFFLNASSFQPPSNPLIVCSIIYRSWKCTYLCLMYLTCCAHSTDTSLLACCDNSICVSILGCRTRNNSTCAPSNVVSCTITLKVLIYWLILSLLCHLLVYPPFSYWHFHNYKKLGRFLQHLLVLVPF